MKSINLILGMYNHQPIGSLHSDFDTAYHLSYIPFLEILNNFPDIRYTYHTSGVLLDWILDNYSQYIEVIQNLINTNQLELQSSGYYEPLLTAIPRNDAVAQIKRMNQKVQTLWKYTPNGVGITAYTWEPIIPSILSDAGITYCAIDDTCFHAAGIQAQDCFYPYITEDNGAVVTVFPVSTYFKRQSIWDNPKEVISYLKSIADDSGERVVVLMENNQSSGKLPEKYNINSNRTHIESLFTLLIENKDWINIIGYNDYLNQFTTQKRLYLNSTGQYIVPDHNNKNDSPMRFQRNIFAQDNDSNIIHKKMLHVHDIIQSNNEVYGIDAALHELYKGQCHNAYWHGEYGDLYNSHLRHAIYHHLINAENIVASLSVLKNNTVTFEKKDINADGIQETVINTPQFQAYISPHQGGYCYELDIKKYTMNIFNTIYQQSDVNHDSAQGLSKNNSSASCLSTTQTTEHHTMKSVLKDNTYPRKGFIDHFLPVAATVDDIIHGIKNEAYPETLITPIKKTHHGVTMNTLWRFSDSPNKAITIEKTLTFAHNATLSIVLKNNTNTSNNCIYGNETSFALLAGHHPDNYFTFYNDTNNQIYISDNYFDTQLSLHDVKYIRMHCAALHCTIDYIFSKPAHCCVAPITTLSGNDAEVCYQGSVIMPYWNITIAPYQQWSCKLELVFMDI